MNRLLIVPALVALLSGCVVGGEAAWHDMEMSKAALKACLAARGPEACAAQQQAYAADLATYRATPKIVIGAGSPPPLPHGFISGGMGAGPGGPIIGGQPVYSRRECIGAIVNGQCFGSILPDYSRPHPTCYGQMLNGMCTGPMF